jgi:PIN domain nuclease of toxin-antitoxin system
MRLLLDTHAFIWAVTGDRALTAAARRLINKAEAVYVSAVSIWEVAIKAPLGKIDADCDELLDAIEASGFIELPVSARHASAVVKLPPLHKDPFDRLLVAQAQTEPLRLLSADPILARYSELVLAI